MQTDTPVEVLKGVGQTVVRRLERLEIATCGDLLHHYPRRYDDFSNILPIKQLRPGPVTVKGKIQQIAARRSFRNRRLSLTEAIITDGTGTIKAIWFNQPYLAKSFPAGTEVVVSGNLEFKNNDLALQTPAIEKNEAQTKDTARIVPVYPETSGISSKQLRGLMLQVLPLAKDAKETLPPDIIDKAGLMARGRALEQIHFPESMESLRRARERIAFEELWYLILTGLIIKREIKTEEAPAIPFNLELAKKFVSAVGFELTDAQRQSAWQILQDMERDRPMNRLLEGDVGSGKTVVAMMSAVMALGAGYQATLMVPTEILARQHAATITQLMAAMGYRTEVLLGKQPAAKKRQVLEAAQDGSVNLVIGTHALLSEQVEFANLGLVIIDEQHRFGVEQRRSLKAKAGRMPHLLSMTATPIPRSLALTVYGDLDLSIIDELPPGRQPVKTKVVSSADRDQTYRTIDEQIKAGRQVFVVCPLIEESDKTGAASVQQELERLAKTVFSHRRIAALHGRMKGEEKQQVMQDFADGKTDILIATSVVEVGIDVPNATVMMVEDADRFGLAALHQLRGRVGRGADESSCYLLSDSNAAGAVQRLKAMERTTDGFRLAQIDLEIRGPGQIYGLAQHGQLELEVADITDTKLLAKVKALAEKFLQAPDALLKYPQIQARINRLKTVTTLD